MYKTKEKGSFKDVDLTISDNKKKGKLDDFGDIQFHLNVEEEFAENA